MNSNNSYSVAIVLCFALGICTMILNHKASNYFWNKLQLNPYLDVPTIRKMRQSTIKQSLLLYCVYMMCIMNMLSFFLCHIATVFPSWFCEYGLTTTMILYFAAKTFFYGYLLERAQLIQNEDHPLLPSFIISKLFPTYLLLYFIIWSIVISLSFRGTLNDEQCVFNRYTDHVSLFVVQAACDIIHCTGLTLLFLVPNCCDILYSRSEVFNTPQQVNIFITQSNIHILCIIFCCLSSLIFMIFSGTKYIWFNASIDMCCNSVAAFLTLTSNRAYLSQFACSSYVNWSKWMQCKLCCNSVRKYMIYRMENAKTKTRKDMSEGSDSDEFEYDHELNGDDDLPGMQNDQSIPMFLNNNSLLTQPEIDDFDLPLMSINDSNLSQTQVEDPPSGMFNLIFLPVH